MRVSNQALTSEAEKIFMASDIYIDGIHTDTSHRRPSIFQRNSFLRYLRWKGFHSASAHTYLGFLIKARRLVIDIPQN